MPILPDVTDVFGVSTSRLSPVNYIKRIQDIVISGFTGKNVLSAAEDQNKNIKDVISKFKQLTKSDQRFNTLILEGLGSNIPPGSNTGAINQGMSLLKQAAAGAEKLNDEPLPAVSVSLSTVQGTLNDVSDLKNVPAFLTTVGAASGELGRFESSIFEASKVGEIASKYGGQLSSGRSALDIEGRAQDWVTDNVAKYAVKISPEAGLILGGPASIISPISQSIASAGRTAVVGASTFGRTAAIGLGLPGIVGSIVLGGIALYGVAETEEIISSQVGTPIRDVAKTGAGAFAGFKLGTLIGGPVGGFAGAGIGALLGLKVF